MGTLDFSTAVLMQAVNFLFDEVRKILTERRERRKEVSQSDDMVASPVCAEQITKEEVLKWEPANWDEELQIEIEHVQALIKTQIKHRRTAEAKIISLGGVKFVPPNVKFELDYAEDQILELSQRLKRLLERVYDQPIEILWLC